MSDRVQIVTQYFRPQPLANAEVVGALAHGLADLGFDVDVVTPAQGARGGDGVSVRHALGWFASDRSSVAKRLLEYGLFSVGALVGSVTAPRPDVIVVPSPPPTLGLIGVVVSRLRGVPLIYVVQDLYPEVALATGALSPGPALRLLGRAMRSVYGRAAAVVVIDPLLADAIERADGRARVVAIRNGIDLGPFRQAARDSAYLSEVGVPAGAPVVMYAGNVGRSQDLDAVIAATAEAGAHLVIHGGGAALDDVKAAVRAAGHAHVHFSAYRPHDEIGRVFASADVHVVPLKADIASASVPSKLLSIFAAGRPAVVTAEPGSAAAAVLAEAGGGWLVPPGDEPALATTLATVLVDRDGLEAAGGRARKWAGEHAGQDRYARQYAELIASVVRERAGSRGGPLPPSA